MMRWLKKLLIRQKTGPPHIRESLSKREMSRRTAALSDEERRAYEWLLAGYSEAWTAETMGLEKSGARAIFAGVYQKLGVDSAREIVHYYAPENVFFNEHPEKDGK